MSVFALCPFLIDYLYSMERAEMKTVFMKNKDLKAKRRNTKIFGICKV